MGKANKKNAAVAATQLPPQELTSEMPKEPKGFNVEAYLGLSAKVAKSTVYYRNKKFKNADKHFPISPLMRTTDKYFPFAEGGELYIDEPQAEHEIKDCLKKAVAMKAEKIRYAYITPDFDLEDVMEQLQEHA